VKATFPNTENLNVNGTDLPSVQQTIQAKLAQDPSITWVVTLSAPVALAALQGTQQGGSQAKIVTFDLTLLGVILDDPPSVEAQSQRSGQLLPRR
jgi:simple sugar transport system substrate-binding protein